MVSLCAIILCAILAVHNYQSYRSTHKISEAKLSEQLLQAEQQHAQAIFQSLHQAISQTLIQPSQQRALVTTLLQHDLVLEVVIYDSNGRVVLPQSKTSRSVNQRLKNYFQRGQALPLDRAAQIQNGNHVLISKPLFQGSQFSGGLVMVYSLAALANTRAAVSAGLMTVRQEQLWTEMTIIALLLALGIIFVGLITTQISHWLFAPIRGLKDYAKAAVGGDFSLPLNTERNDEFGELARDVELLSSRICQQEAEAKQLAFRDNLTLLPNRRGFRQHLNDILKRAGQQHRRFALLIIDLDNFKRVNDSLSHDVGDELLVAVAQRLKDSLDEYSLVYGLGEGVQDYYLARIGGDEFAIVLPGVDGSEEAALVAQRSLTLLQNSYMSSSHEIKLGASIGITLYPQDGNTAAKLLKNADMAMYQAKACGRDRYQFFAEFMSVSAIKRLNVEIELRRALDNDELRLYYQPKFDMNRRIMIGSEALLRWQHPQRGLVGPDYLMEVAEESGLIGSIGSWVTREVCRQLQAWKGSPLGELPVAVNISAAEFRLRDVVSDLRQCLDRFSIAPGLVQVEVTETVIVSNEEDVGRDLELLRNMGIKIWMDDFGTGYSSLGYLRRFPVDGLKIDRSFVSEIAHNPADDSLCRAIVAMANRLNLEVIAEGVETMDQFRQLQGGRCTLAQGYFYARPMLPEVLEKQAAFLLQLEDVAPQRQSQSQEGPQSPEGAAENVVPLNRNI